MKRVNFSTYLLILLLMLVAICPSAFSSQVNSQVITSHERAWHYLSSIAYTGDTIELEDGSIWLIPSSSSYTIQKWGVNDLIVITSNWWFSNWPFRLLNLTRAEWTETKISIAPYYNGDFTSWITQIDYYQGILMLEDGSTWLVHPTDIEHLRHYKTNTTVIIGVNQDWHSTNYPNILIDAISNTFIRTICQHK